MAKAASNLTDALGRLIKIAVVVALLPLAVSLVIGMLRAMEAEQVLGVTAREWVIRGFLTYVAVHVALYRPVALFQFNHRLFSTLAVWLFGGQVASTEDAPSGKVKVKKGAKAETSRASAGGSTLVAFSPYVIPLYTIIVCLVGGVLRSRWDRPVVGGVAAFLIGLTMAFHWLMTADDLQSQRSRWHLETYLLAIGLVFILTLLIADVFLPWAMPAFSPSQALAEAMAHARAVYATLIQRLFL